MAPTCAPLPGNKVKLKLRAQVGGWDGEGVGVVAGEESILLLDGKVWGM